MRVIDGGLTFSWAAISPTGSGAVAAQRAEHGELVEREVVAVALDAQAAGQAHHAEAQRAGGSASSAVVIASPQILSLAT